jgi:hypothetical protein
MSETPFFYRYIRLVACLGSPERNAKSEIRERYSFREMSELYTKCVSKFLPSSRMFPTPHFRCSLFKRFPRQSLLFLGHNYTAATGNIHKTDTIFRMGVPYAPFARFSAI